METDKKKIELLAPARDFDTAVAAVDYGADALYMGAPRFGARYAAGNSVDDIASVVDYAKRYGVRVYTTLNTILFDNELKDAERTAREVIQAGVDALIVQDMAYTQMGLTGVELHASTQTFNLKPEKVKFLQDAGFARVILERNISLDDIKAVREATDVDLECFVHGAICVCYSGRCYMSRSMSPRSGNRGDCSQACRLSYDLTDAKGKIMERDKHLLSVKDYDLSARLGEMIDAGIMSFKIEGRLKDASYVKNVVNHYRRCLDQELECRTGFVRSSLGSTITDFVPDISKTFSRGRTEYFYSGRRAGVSTPDTPKATGEYIGSVKTVGRGWFEIDGGAVLAAGDGICCLADGEFVGTNVNGAQGRRIFPNKELPVAVGTDIYRNYDHKFNQFLDGCRTRRVVDVKASVEISKDVFKVIYRDEEGITASVKCDCVNGAAKDIPKMADAIATQLARSGDTIFRVTAVEFIADGEVVTVENINVLPFVRVSELNALRRECLDVLLDNRMSRPTQRSVVCSENAAVFPYAGADGSENIVNSLSRAFYMDAGCVDPQPGYDLQENLTGVAVMRTPFCIRRENGICHKGSAEPLWLTHGQHRYRLEFRCEECVMEVICEGLK